MIEGKEGGGRPRKGGTISVPGGIDTKDPKAPPASPIQRDFMLVGLSAIPHLTRGAGLAKPFWFQSAPLNEMPRDYTWQWDDYGTVDSGIHSNPITPGLAVYAFETLFTDADPVQRITYLEDDNILDMVAHLKQIGDSMSPFQMQFGNPRLWGGWEVVKAVTMRSLRVTEKAGEPDARYVTVSFTEFPDAPKLRAVAAPKPPAGKGHKGSHTNANGQEILAVLNPSTLPPKMRTMAQIAKVYYGAVSGWRLIAKASGFTSTGPNEDLHAKFGRKKPPPKIVVPRRKQ